MEKIFLVCNDRLDEVNEELAKGGAIKFICPLEGKMNEEFIRSEDRELLIGVAAYVVIEYPE